MTQQISIKCNNFLLLDTTFI